MMIPQKEAENAASNTGVFDYPNKANINPSPLFCVEQFMLILTTQNQPPM